MKAKKSYAEYLKDWRHLLGQFAANAALAGTSAAERQASLATVVAKIDELLQQQSERNAAKQTASEDIRLQFNQGRELARDIKLELKGSLGARSLDLVRFKVNPLREGSKTKKAAPKVASKRAAKGEPQPEAPTPPAANDALSPNKA